MFRFISRTVFKFTIIALIILSFLVLGNVYTYQRLTDEKPIVQLRFIPVQQQEFDALLRLGEQCEEKIYRLYGDEWRIDAQFLKWKSWTTLFGVDAMYRVDRLSGRYIDIEDENTQAHSAHELKQSSTIDLSQLAEQYDNKFPPIDTVYGSSAYEKMTPETIFTVYRTQSGIIIREHGQDKAEESCIDDESIWKNTILKMDQKLAALIHSIQWMPAN